ncbi:cyclodeaminase/cyclohydrolase family protein [Anoxynatronum buryatiense]|uniref:Formiminotetrahydrofolate cyclodeaminase n=1 Tax=Anoxynatronum buryatiense TaxID=489973 RepID=A0AA45WUN9_9CLOT|nr:cyclodeaminase/cyclohydrolase family protein [Anoxynatronum buryatiense]SMP44524.1 formiminotetrahydrofolate cyclodeaminase [Anoxynatronum buryatiense]
MKLTELKTKEFVSTLASDAPAPGGGSASALFGALGTALVSMVANLTTGKEKYAAYEDRMKEVLKETEGLMESFNNLIEKDTEVYNAVGDVLTMPKTTDEEKAKRKEAMQQALKEATIVPYTMMEEAAKVLVVLQKAMGHSNPNAVSDLGVGALGLKAAMQGAWLNVKINLGSIKDEAFVSEYRAKGEKLLADNLALADSLYQEVEKQL